jgi:hypothetical protein
MKGLSSWGAIILLPLLSSPAMAQVPVPPPAQIILIRHAEKPADPDDPHLSPAGVRRAQRLVSFIRTNPAITRFGLPVAIFATRTTKHDNAQRSGETVAPLGRALRLPVQTPYRSRSYAALAQLILANPSYSGKTVLICWNHEEMAQLAAALGVRPRPARWEADVYDLVWLISWRGGRAVLSAVTQ